MQDFRDIYNDKSRYMLSRLTDEGRAIAEMIYERHELLSKGLVALGVDPKVATEDACRIEHVISAESFAAIKKHLHLSRDAE